MSTMQGPEPVPVPDPVPVSNPVPVPAARAARLRPYAPESARASIDLRLDKNEGRGPSAEVLQALLAEGVEAMRRYPIARSFEVELAERHMVAPEQVLVTAGIDDAIHRACLAMLADGGELILPVPTFEMIARYAALAGGKVIEVPWPEGPYPLDAVLARVGERTRMIALVSPNNPTGATATATDLRAISKAAPHGLILVDQAYAEFADEQLTSDALALGNALVLRTFSKAWGMAGLRVGYAIGGAEWLQVVRACGNPFPVTGPSLLLARAWLRSGAVAVAEFVAQVRRERAALFALLRELGAEPLPSQANFVSARFRDAVAVRDALARQGIWVRAFPGDERLQGMLRITCPGDARDFDRLAEALRKGVRDERPTR